MVRGSSKGRGAPTDEELAAELDKLDPPAEPEAEAEPEDFRMGVPEGYDMAPVLIGRILAEVGPVVKDQKAKAGGTTYNFRGIDQVTNAVNAAFKRHRVFPTSKIVSFNLRDTMTTGESPRPTREVTLTIVYRFTAPDGSFVETEVPGESLDTSDKATPKAMSVGLRIALLQMLLLPTGDPTTDHEYHTRDGVGSMSGSVAALLSGRIQVADVAEMAGPIRAALHEHAAWDHPVPGLTEDGGTWLGSFAARLAHIVSEVDSYEAGVALKEQLTETKLIGVRTGEGETLADLLKKRGLELRDLYAKTLDHVISQVLAAKGGDELDIAIGCGWAALEAGSIRVEGINKAVVLADERRAKLPEYAPQPEAGEAEENRDGEPADSVPFDGPYVGDAEPGPGQWDGDPTAGALVPPSEEDTGHRGGYDRAAFRAFWERASAAPMVGLGEERVIRAAAVANELAALMLPDDDGISAATFGTDGFVLVDDAIKAAHRREGTIGDEQRAELDHMLARHREAAGA